MLSGDTYWAASGAIGRLAANLPATARDGRVYLLPLPAWELEALWEVLLVFRRAQAGEPETAELLELVQELSGTLFSPSRTAAEFVADLESVVAVLMLDIPAVRTLATALVLDAPRDLAVHEAYAQISAAWEAAGVRC
ncbi:hypothetical protein ABCR94_13375 [Streptomyces sp. 21So2-11]|uniref:hypothetical protein n=1 Tax=Streptomyces sp. 21So2-11 TaxID=3144408 RepID=UPI003218EBDB